MKLQTLTLAAPCPVDLTIDENNPIINTTFRKLPKGQPVLQIQINDESTQLLTLALRIKSESAFQDSPHIKRYEGTLDHLYFSLANPTEESLALTPSEVLEIVNDHAFINSNLPEVPVHAKVYTIPSKA